MLLMTKIKTAESHTIKSDLWPCYWLSAEYYLMHHRTWTAVTVASAMDCASGIDQICPASAHTSLVKVLSASHPTDM